LVFRNFAQAKKILKDKNIAEVK